jgi:UDP:flavonoid glycosyltransferase YjiC (YdhE family)
MRVLLTTLTLSGHFHPLVPLARALAVAGHEVAFATGPAFCAQITANGFAAFPAGPDSIPAEEREARWPDYARLREPDRSFFNQEVLFAGVYADARARDLLRLFDRWRPDVLVRETWEFGGWLAAEVAGLPFATFEIGADARLIWRHEMIGRALNELRERLGLRPDPSLAGITRYLQLSCMPPSLGDPTVPQAPTFYAFRAESFNRSGDEVLPGWVADLPQRPTVHATLGTAYNRRTDLFHVILDALRDEAINVILTVGRDRDPMELGPQPPNVHIERYIPQSLLLPHCDAMVQHGGWNSVLAALEAAIPMVLLPIGADQPQNAARCGEAGVAVVMGAESVTPRALRAATRAVLERPSYRENAQRVCAEIAALPVMKNAVGLLERLAVEKGPVLAT